MATTEIQIQKAGFGQTMRRDAWWHQPAAVFFGLSAFIIYSTWAAFQGVHYTHGPYLSPMYSPEFFGTGGHALFGEAPPIWPSWLPYSPAFLILWAPAGFRLTCYYYRGAYYKAFWADPPNCAVSEPRKKYLGENSLPLILQNIHRYFLYVALAFIVVLSIDAIKGFWFTNPESGKGSFGIGVGSLVLVLNVILLGGYTMGCHSLRHLVGGIRDCISKCSKPRQCAYDCVSCLNRGHMKWAWMSLVWVGFTDLYVRLCSMGIWTDFRIL
ncbi:MAG: succinate dehydrogenase [Roseibacillus sp.]